MLNQFSVKKLGEVLAFAKVGEETFAKGGGALREVFDPETGDAFRNTNREQITLIENFAREAEVEEAVAGKSESTSAKLRNMRELYLKEEDWRDAAELLEWLGFFEGAAVVHWSLVQGAAEQSGDQKLLEVAAAGRAFHDNVFEKVAGAVRELAKARAGA